MDINPLKTEKVSEVVYFCLIDGSKVVGSLHLPHNTRFTEAINIYYDQKPFVPLTNVTVVDAAGEEKKCAFLVINREQVLFCYPIDEN